MLKNKKGKTSGWTPEKNKKFEVALAKHDRDEPDRWAKIATAMGGTDEEEVKRMYQLLLHDIDLILSGKVPLPNYKNVCAMGSNIISHEVGEIDGKCEAAGKSRSDHLSYKRKDICSNFRDAGEGIKKERKLPSVTQLMAKQKQFMKHLSLH